ncbi:MAG: AraC family transcriptional regulator [Bacteroidia bacterium]|nr:AraC family transcriptional regulator [Bacteroidia bacterium]
MKLQYKSTEKDIRSSIYVKRVFQPYLGGNWHFHKEFELIYFLEGQGHRIVGDHISHFQKGELVLVGEWLPHLWRNDANFDGKADFIVVKFAKEFLGVNLFSLPELSEIRVLLQKSFRGILFSKKTQMEIGKLLLQLSESKSVDLLINFLKVLNILSRDEDYQLLSSPHFVLPSSGSRENRLQKVITYISNNYSRNINLEEISGIAHMTPPAFCRFFKNSTHKTFSHFLNEVRISKACQLLINGEISIKEICYEVGFNSLTNFNRTFRSIKGETPSSYRAAYSLFRHSLSPV